MSRYYSLDGKPCTRLEWSAIFRGKERLLRNTALTSQGKKLSISTVFLGVDHRFSSEGPPVLWETMLFSDMPDLQEEQMRYTNMEDALEEHLKIEHALRAEGWSVLEIKVKGKQVV